jgi:hypothetical protein
LLVTSEEGSVYGFELNGPNNVARDNAYWDSPLFGGSGWINGGGNVELNPMFTSTGCNGFVPGNAAAQGYGVHS